MRKWIEPNPTALERAQALGYNKPVPRSTGDNIRKVAGYESPATLWAKSATKKHPEDEILVTVACSSYETYGPNSNGDGFPAEKAYPEYGISEADLLINHYKSFEKGKVHWMHDMKKPVGVVLKAFWNDKYQWVELVIEIDHKVVPAEAMKKLQKGHIIFMSMGCDVRYDVCTVCGNHSSTDPITKKTEYCEHIQDNLLELIDGKVSAMLNPAPNFDDISIVFIPADAIAATLYRKVASKGGKGAKGAGNVATSSEKPVQAHAGYKRVSKFAASMPKIASLYKDTAFLEGIKQYQENYGDLVSEMTTGMKKSRLEEVLAFFVNEDLPLPLNSVCKKYSLDVGSVLESQKKILNWILEANESLDAISEAIQTDTDLQGPVTSLMNKTDFPCKGPEAVTAMFNLINKLRILERPLTDKLPKGSPIYKDIEDIVSLEFLV